MTMTYYLTAGIAINECVSDALDDLTVSTLATHKITSGRWPSSEQMPE